MAIAPRLAALISALALAGLMPAVARADPQANAGLTVGLAGRGFDRAVWDRSVFHLGFRGDVLLGRSGNRDFGFGPYGELLTYAFDEFQVGVGASALLPVSDSFPLVVSAGIYGRSGGDPKGLEPGVAAALFWGSRSYNFHAGYVMAGGLLAQMRLGLGELKETTIMLGAQLDLAFMTLPVVMLFNAATGPSPEAAAPR